MSKIDLHQKYLIDMDHPVSYPQFCRCIPENIKKPKPEDWGTCLCKACLNPELKIECIKQLLSVSLELQEINIQNVDDIVIGVCEQIKKSNLTFEYLEWSTEIIKRKKKKKTLFIQKSILVQALQNFLQNALNQISTLSGISRGLDLSMGGLVISKKLSVILLIKVY